MLTLAIISVAVAGVASLALTGVMRRLALRCGLVDHPDAHRKFHRQAMPLGGGIAVFLATAGVLGALLLLPHPLREGLREQMGELPILLLAGLVVVIVGVVDDRTKLPGRYKLLGQVVAVAILMAGGVVIDGIGIFGWEIELGLLAVPFTLFWMLGAINALNLLDGIDGLASTVGIILSVTIAAMAVAAGRPAEVALIAAVFAASLAGFLRFNFPPATIFLGDAGSMFIGLMVGALSIQGSLKGPGTVLLAAPLAIWTIPIFDSAAAILRRTLTGRSIYTTDRSHLHHRLLELLGSNRRVLGWLGLCCAVTSTAALLSVLLRSDLLAVMTGLAVVMVFVITGLFGRTELALLGTRLQRIGRSLVPRKRSRAFRPHPARVRFRGSRSWELLWETLTESVGSLGVNELSLDINGPFSNGGCRAFWESGHRDSSDPRWHFHFPLVVGNQRVGWLKVVGQCNNHSTSENIQQLVEILEPFEKELLAAAESAMPAAKRFSHSSAVEEVSHE